MRLRRGKIDGGSSRLSSSNRGGFDAPMRLPSLTPLPSVRVSALLRVVLSMTFVLQPCVALTDLEDGVENLNFRSRSICGLKFSSRSIHGLKFSSRSICGLKFRSDLLAAK
ncbi:hypothetical protein Tsubulata_029335 [Turnera subulata]|uniref:Uncharacterized protein n=1 Tax=Turnera subulata TaxID=218843 RepID=A0A9Q0J643_9ROSI|nr:hypothetical protein Tsubulata_029335 [Turnera subulata]